MNQENAARYQPPALTGLDQTVAGERICSPGCLHIALAYGQRLHSAGAWFGVPVPPFGEEKKKKKKTKRQRMAYFF